MPELGLGVPFWVIALIWLAKVVLLVLSQSTGCAYPSGPLSRADRREPGGHRVVRGRLLHLDWSCYPRRYYRTDCCHSSNSVVHLRFQDVGVTSYELCDKLTPWSSPILYRGQANAQNTV